MPRCRWVLRRPHESLFAPPPGRSLHHFVVADRRVPSIQVVPETRCWLLLGDQQAQPLEGVDVGRVEAGCLHGLQHLVLDVFQRRRARVVPAPVPARTGRWSSAATPSGGLYLAGHWDGLVGIARLVYLLVEALAVAEGPILPAAATRAGGVAGELLAGHEVLPPGQRPQDGATWSAVR